MPARPDPSVRVEFTAVSKDYGARRALDGVTLEIRAGEVFGLLGPNGSGKSTLLKLLLGLLVPTAGRVRVNGVDVATDGPRARALIGYVPEDAPLYPQMRAREFLSFMGRLKGLGGAALNDELERVSSLLALDAVRDLPLGALSHGFRQRVLIAQALLNAPPLLVFDEPTNGLDPHQIIELRGLLRALTPHHTVLLTTHVLSEVEKVATRVGILLHGRLRAVTDVAGASTRVRLHALPPPGVELAEVIGGVAGVAIVAPLPERIPGAAFDLQCESPAARTALALRLRETGCAVLELQPAGSDLEARFLALTAESTA